MAPLTGVLVLAALLALPGIALAAPKGEAGADAHEAAPAVGAASGPLWRAPGIPAEDDWDDLDAAVKAEASSHPAPPRPVQPARPGPREGTAAPTRGQAAEEPSAAKQVAKSALAWLKEAVPWAFPDQQEAPPREIVVTGDMLLGSPHDVIAPGAGHRVGGGAPTPAALPPPSVVSDGAAADGRRVARGSTGDLIQEALAFAREVAQHPMTWLLIALAVVGRLAIWFLARPARHARVHRRRRRRHHR